MGRYFLRHQIVPRPIYKVAGTVPAHFDQGFMGQLSKLTFRPTVDVQLGYVAKISEIVLDYATRALKPKKAYFLKGASGVYTSGSPFSKPLFG